MDFTDQQIAIVGPENFRLVAGELAMNATGLFRLADAVARGIIEGDKQAALKLREQARATIQARKQLN